MLMVNELIGFGVAGDQFAFSNTDSSTATAGGVSTHTFSALSFGVPAETRRIIVAISTFSFGGDPFINSVSIDGVSATLHVNNSDTDTSFPNGTCQAIIASAAVPLGTSGDVVVGFTGSVTSERVTVAIFRAVGLESTSPFDTSSDDDDVVSMSINVPAGGFIIGAAGFVDTGAISTAGINEVLEASGTVVAATGYLDAETGRSVTFDGSNNDAAGAIASWR